MLMLGKRSAKVYSTDSELLVTKQFYTELSFKDTSFYMFSLKWEKRKHQSTFIKQSHFYYYYRVTHLFVLVDCV